MNWLDPEPDRESSDYEKYIEVLQSIEKHGRADFYKGFHQPPTEEEYNRRLFEDQYRGVNVNDGKDTKVTKRRL